MKILFQNNYLKLSIGKKRHIKIEIKLIFLIFSNVLVINLGVSVLIGLTLVCNFPGGPFDFKTYSKNTLACF